MTDAAATPAPNPELLRALAARYGTGNYRVEDGGAISVRLPSGRWRRVTKRLGRPAHTKDGRGLKVTIYMDPTTHAHALALGDGKLSVGIRRALLASMGSADVG